MPYKNNALSLTLLQMRMRKQAWQSNLK